ncbi:MAG: hypothetical protein WDA74_07305, partial [Spirochaetota bacterium]
MKNIIKPAILLATVAFSASLLLIMVRGVTYPVILQQERDRERNALMMVLPGYEIGESRVVALGSGEQFRFWIGEKIVDDEVLTG